MFFILKIHKQKIQFIYPIRIPHSRNILVTVSIFCKVSLWSRPHLNGSSGLKNCNPTTRYVPRYTPCFRLSLITEASADKIIIERTKQHFTPTLPQLHA